MDKRTKDLFDVMRMKRRRLFEYHVYAKVSKYTCFGENFDSLIILRESLARDSWLIIKRDETNQQVLHRPDIDICGVNFIDDGVFSIRRATPQEIANIKRVLLVMIELKAKHGGCARERLMALLD